MANWLQKIVTPQGPSKGRNLPMQVRQGGMPVQTGPYGRAKDQLPNASIIYGMAASALFVVALCFLFTGRWFTGLLVLSLAACFLGFALYFMRHPS